MDDWENFNEKPLLEQQDFYRHLNLEADITDAEYTQKRKFAKILK